MCQMTIQQFKTVYNELLLCSGNTEELRYKLEQFISSYKDRLPPFYPGHIITRVPITKQTKGDIPFFYSGHKYSEAKPMNMNYCQVEFTIRPEQCIGDAWLFKNDHSEGRPKPWALAHLLTGESAKIPAPFLWKAGDYYLCTDGCHRIYAAYLLGRTVRVSCDREYTNITPIN